MGTHRQNTNPYCLKYIISTRNNAHILHLDARVCVTRLLARRDIPNNLVSDGLERGSPGAETTTPSLPAHGTLGHEEQVGEELTNGDGPSSIVPETLSLRTKQRTSRRRRGGAMFTVLFVASLLGVASGTTFIMVSGYLTANTTPSTILDCGFVSLSTTNTVGAGLPSGTSYISFSPALTGTSPASSVSVTPTMYGTGAQGSEYLDGEMGIGCSSTPSSGALSMSVLISGSGSLSGSASWMVLFVAPHSSDVYCQPGSQVYSGGSCISGTQSACDSSVTPAIYLPNNGADSSGTGGNTVAWSYGVGALEGPCSKSGASDPFSLSVSNSISGMTVMLDVSFAYGGAVHALGGTPPRFSLTVTTSGT